jgi:hypothetical protein
MTKEYLDAMEDAIRSAAQATPEAALALIAEVRQQMKRANRAEVALVRIKQAAIAYANHATEENAERLMDLAVVIHSDEVAR